MPNKYDLLRTYLWELIHTVQQQPAGPVTAGGGAADWLGALLLRQTNWTVTQIAEGLEFTDTAHFCTFFKRQTTRTPGDFRAYKLYFQAFDSLNSLTGMPTATRPCSLRW